MKPTLKQWRKRSKRCYFSSRASTQACLIPASVSHACELGIEHNVRSWQAVVVAQGDRHRATQQRLRVIGRLVIVITLHVGAK